MLRFHGRAATYGELWYDEVPPAEPAVDILMHRQQRTPMANARSAPFLSLTSDLAASDDAIVAAFSRECRYEIRRADAKDGLAVQFLHAPREHLEAFTQFHDAFAERKNVQAADRLWLEAACGADRLLLACARRDGEALVWHAYLKCGGVSRLLHSVSLFRDRDAGYRALVGRANRWLHWRGMLELKACGMKSYDWGGLFEDEAIPGNAGINRFKRSFGGSQFRSFDCTRGVTLRGRMYLPLRDAWRRYRHGGPRPDARKRAWQPCSRKLRSC